MALLFPATGENIALEAIVNKTAPQNLVLKLYVNNITPSHTDIAGTYTEASFTGYAAITLTGASWNSASGGSISYSSQQSFTCSTTGTTQNVYGYFVVQASSGTLVYAERDPSAPFPITNTGDSIKLTPTITAT
jgi:hypothetical protein